MAATRAFRCRCARSWPRPRTRHGPRPRTSGTGQGAARGRGRQKLVNTLNAGQPQNEGSRRLLAAAAQGARLDKRLWTELAQLTGANGNSTSLVSAPDQVAEAMLDYYRLGVSTFLIRGFDPLPDALQYGRALIPRVRALVAAEAPQHAHAAE